MEKTLGNTDVNGAHKNMEMFKVEIISVDEARAMLGVDPLD